MHPHEVWWISLIKAGLPSAVPGMEISVINQSATATGPNVFPQSGQTINALSANTAIYDRMSAWELVEYFGLLYGMDGARLRARMEEVFSTLQMNDFRDTLGAKMSTGMRQKVSIARAIIHDPPVLIFDEATSSLDPESESIIQQHLAAIARGRTIILVTHRLSFVARADAIIVVDSGHLVQVGAHETLLGSCLPYKQLWSQQARMFQ